MIERSQVLAGVSRCLVETLDVAPEEVHEETRLMTELGADSLDLLDLVFHLEQEFGIKISPRQMERRARDRLGAVPLERDGVYSPEALAELRRAMPEVPADELVQGLRTNELPRLFRVATMVNLVCELLAAQGRGDGHV